MYQVVDSQGEETGPQINSSHFYAYFFVIFIFVCTFFFLNFLAGVIFMNFQEAQRAELASLWMEKKEINWVDILKLIVEAKPNLETTTVPKNPILKFLHKFVTSKQFETVIMICIPLNVIQMAFTYEGQSKQYALVLKYINYGLSLIFITETSLKVITFGLSFFSNSLNTFYFIIISTSVVDIFTSYFKLPSLPIMVLIPQLFRVVRVMKLSRLYRLMKKHSGLLALIKTILFSMPALFNVFILLFILFFIFAVFGCFLFNNVTRGTIIDDYSNFSNFGNAMLMCIRILTGEQWPSIMFDLSNTNPDCIEGKTWGTSYAPLFFIWFQLICTYTILNLFILVIIQKFDTYYLADDSVITLFDADLAIFKKAWTALTKQNQCIKIRDNKLVLFFKTMSSPIGMEDEEINNDSDILRNIVIMNIKQDENGYIYFNELLYKVMKKKYGIKNVKNKVLADKELAAYVKINNIQKKKSQGLISDNKMYLVNPFLQFMYYKISFNTWMHFVRQIKEQEIIQQNLRGSCWSDEDYSISESDISSLEDSEYSYETERIELIDSEYESLNENDEKYIFWYNFSFIS